jgi:hypothetical protein
LPITFPPVSIHDVSGVCPVLVFVFFSFPEQTESDLEQGRKGEREAEDGNAESDEKL